MKIRPFIKKVTDIFKSSEFSALNQNHSASFQKHIRNFLNSNTSVVCKEQKWKFISMNSSPN